MVLCPAQRQRRVHEVKGGSCPSVHGWIKWSGKEQSRLDVQFLREIFVHYSLHDGQRFSLALGFSPLVYPPSIAVSTMVC